MLQRIRQMLIKEFIQLFRDPKMRPIIFIMPVMQLLIFGYAATTDVHDIATVVQDLDYSVASRELLAQYSRSGYFEFVEYVSDERRVQDVLDRGQAQVVIRIIKGFAEDIGAGRTAYVQMLVDGTDSNTARIVLDYGSRIANQYSQRVLVERLERLTGEGLPETVELRSRAWFNPNLESRNFYVPGVMAILVMIAVLMLTSMAIVREKEIGTMEQILVTPIRPFEFILGKTIPFALIGFFDVLLISVVGVFWFDIPVAGSKLLMLLATTFYLMTAIGAGLLISTISRTQQQALMTSFFFSFPAILLSGFMFPVANMPVIVQWMTLANPMRYFVDIIRGIFLMGVGIDVLWQELIGLLVIGLLTLTAAVKRFHKTAA